LGWRTDVTLTAGQRRLAEGLASHAATILASAPARAELAVSEAQYRTLYEAVPCGVLVRSPSGEIVHANAAMAAMVGIPVEQLSGRKSTDLWQVIREDGAPRVAANLNLTEGTYRCRVRT